MGPLFSGVGRGSPRQRQFCRRRTRASTNDAEFDENKADISYDLPAVQVEQLLTEIYAPLVGRTLLMAGSGPEAIPTTATVTLKTESPADSERKRLWHWRRFSA